MQCGEAFTRRGDDPSEMDVKNICIDEDMIDDPGMIILGQKVLKYEIYANGPEHGGIFGSLLNAS